MKRHLPFALSVVLMLSLNFYGCGSSGSSSLEPNPDAAEYADFGATLSNTFPAGLKAGGANADIAAALGKELSGTCLASYTDCPDITAANGGDSAAGEILMRLWGLDYNDACTEALIADGTCFNCVDCDTGSVGTTNFIIPTMLASPTTCDSTSTTAGRYVNMGVDPCFFDAMIGQINNIATCKTVAGGAVSLASAVPWYASWGLPETVNFSSYYSRGSGGGIWWTVNNGAAGDQQYFLSLDSDWLYSGIKDPATDKFMFFGTGSPAYYSGRGEGSGVNISAYAGTLSTIPAQFEAMQVRVQDEKYIERITSNETYIWYQSWSGTSFPAAPSEVATKKDSPSMNRCVLIGDKVVSSKYVPLAQCTASFATTFGIADSVTALNANDNYTLKVIDGETASAISFTTSLTPSVTSSSCLEETPVGE
ncbi:MAG: hypothetical protein COV46_03610 [Deltaproteobacteria bacterium CG11_big_fil_rev_8_21_14_0_20_49_13]|nr:MAG: hypothetical protein COV46_03610 [Deltaproteobacteria bacterium CG11_big_fil_rev_8_21_14_0_20_49_13]